MLGVGAGPLPTLLASVAVAAAQDGSGWGGRRPCACHGADGNWALGHTDLTVSPTPESPSQGLGLTEHPPR